MNTNKVSKGSSATRPSSKRERAIRQGLGQSCMTCGESVCWSRETPSKAAHKGTLGHVIARELFTTGGGYIPGNIGAQCWACNWDAKCAKKNDLTNDVIPGMVPDRFLPQKVADNRADIRDCEPATNLPDWDARKVARKRRGLDW